ncbi:alpha/beta fold hydrolase [Patulibacter brassicae]|jgi:alpha-beta hydrolase superfamily lysophospholipase|uniref:Alpha/beta fold hydrolase n=1 Tax=Patulibacter brassicae TaxID=1705717 RepID=A0ABU4VG48_9ACTN|nr:alpha/beta fold hydrolase [Patulibacter brassicae]MDX8150405.1 alpha/beta fold hydrolase [Patulibacter brassicae]
MSDVLYTDGHAGRLAVHRWDPAEPQRIVVLAHGYGEHAGRYEHVADRLTADGALVVAPDHAGHGRSDGERALLEDLERVVDDLAVVGGAVLAERPGLPVAAVGHSLGGIIATRLAQRGDLPLRSLALSGPVIGGNPELLALAGMDPIPDVPIDPAVLSRDPAVGVAYAQDELVHHGPFLRPTLLAIGAAVDAIAAAAPLRDLPVLWVHGEEDELAPLVHAEPAVAGLGAASVERHVYPGARHEVLNETNRDEVIAVLVDFVRRTTT